MKLEDFKKITFRDGSVWYLKDDVELHCHPSGNKFWWFNNKRHREDGPAIEYTDGEVEYWINDSQVDPSTLENNYPELYNDWLIRRIMGS
jgi:hypothetical protein